MVSVGFTFTTLPVNAASNVPDDAVVKIVAEAIRGVQVQNSMDRREPLGTGQEKAAGPIYRLVRILLVLDVLGHLFETLKSGFEVVKLAFEVWNRVRIDYKKFESGISNKSNRALTKSLFFSCSLSSVRLVSKGAELVLRCPKSDVSAMPSNLPTK